MWEWREEGNWLIFLVLIEMVEKNVVLCWEMVIIWVIWVNMKSCLGRYWFISRMKKLERDGKVVWYWFLSKWWRDDGGNGQWIGWEVEKRVKYLLRALLWVILSKRKGRNGVKRRRKFVVLCCSFRALTFWLFLELCERRFWCVCWWQGGDGAVVVVVMVWGCCGIDLEVMALLWNWLGMLWLFLRLMIVVAVDVVDGDGWRGDIIGRPPQKKGKSKSGCELIGIADVVFCPGSCGVKIDLTYKPSLLLYNINAPSMKSDINLYTSHHLIGSNHHDAPPQQLSHHVKQ